MASKKSELISFLNYPWKRSLFCVCEWGVFWPHFVMNKCKASPLCYTIIQAPWKSNFYLSMLQTLLFSFLFYLFIHLAYLFPFNLVGTTLCYAQGLYYAWQYWKLYVVLQVQLSLATCIFFLYHLLSPTNYILIFDYLWPIRLLR